MLISVWVSPLCRPLEPFQRAVALSAELHLCYISWLRQSSLMLDGMFCSRRLNNLLFSLCCAQIRDVTHLNLLHVSQRGCCSLLWKILISFSCYCRADGAYKEALILFLICLNEIVPEDISAHFFLLYIYIKIMSGFLKIYISLSKVHCFHRA